MLALTIKQPWAYAICHLGKDVENRTWKPPAHAIGTRIAIHAGKRYDTPEGYAEFIRIAACVVDNLPKAAGEGQLLDDRGAVVATAVVGTWVTRSDSPWFCGPIGWVICDVHVLWKAVPCRGMQGLWKLPDDVDALVEHR